MSIAAPSVLSLDYSRMSEQIRELNESGAKWIHYDVMDGHFVPNLSFGPDILRGIRKASDLYLDVHVMIEDPVRFADIFLDAGADNYTFHIEALKDEKKIKDLAAHIHEKGKHCGLSVKPGTQLEALKPFLNDFDLFLIMSVEPGFGGQKFNPSSTERIAVLKQWLKEAGSQALIEVDGGINAETAELVKQAGCDVLVAGSYVFGQDIRKAVEILER